MELLRKTLFLLILLAAPVSAVAQGSPSEPLQIRAEALVAEREGEYEEAVALWHPFSSVQ